MADINEINRLIKEAQKITSNIYMEYKNDVLEIYEAGECNFSEELTKDDCYKLSELFNKLGNEISK